jgi:excisionase family DNA binding protein
MATSDNSSLLTPKRVAELLGISRRTLYNWVQRGLFPAPMRLGPNGRTLRWTPTQIINHLKTTHAARAAPSSPGDGAGLPVPPGTGA